MQDNSGILRRLAPYAFAAAVGIAAFALLPAPRGETLYLAAPACEAARVAGISVSTIGGGNCSYSGKAAWRWRTVDIGGLSIARSQVVASR
jgi:hypothetical protein